MDDNVIFVTPPSDCHKGMLKEKDLMLSFTWVDTPSLGNECKKAIV